MNASTNTTSTTATTEIEQLELFTMHPYAWERWLPEQMKGYVYRNEGSVAIGVHPDCGWFVLHRDEEGHKQVFYKERKQPVSTQVDNAMSLTGMRYGAYPEEAKD